MCGSVCYNSYNSYCCYVSSHSTDLTFKSFSTPLKLRHYGGIQIRLLLLFLLLTLGIRVVRSSVRTYLHVLGNPVVLWEVVEKDRQARKLAHESA